MADGVLKGIYSEIFGRSHQLSQNKLFDPSTPSMRKGHNRGEKTGKKKQGGGRKENKDVFSGH